MNFSFLYRKKKVDDDRLEETKLARVLNTLDLTALGIIKLLCDSSITYCFNVDRYWFDFRCWHLCFSW
jgi:hypothetical protein